MMTGGGGEQSDRRPATAARGRYVPGVRRWIWPLLGAGGIVLVVVALLAVVQRSRTP